MAYTTDNAIRNYITIDGTTGVGTDVIGTYAVSLGQSWADSIIDLKLSKRYDVPFASVPPAIASISTTLSAWTCLRPLYTGEIPSSIAQVKEEYDRAMQLLNDIQNDVIDLPLGTISGGGIVTEKGNDTKYWSSTMNYVPTMDVDDELLWRTDINRLEDIASKRNV